MLGTLEVNPRRMRDHRDGAAIVPAQTAPDEGIPAGAGDGGGSLVRYDYNHNGEIIWTEAHPHGMAPVRPSRLTYPYMGSGDGNFIVCETACP